MTTVAVIGAGVAGIAAAWELDRAGIDVTIFEEGASLGGHTHTHMVPGGARDGSDLPVDMGFIVHNTRTYPEFVVFLEELGIEVRDTEMSFSVSCAGCGLEYSGRSFWAQLPGIARPRVIRLFAEIRRFQRDARETLTELDIGTAVDLPETLAEYVTSRGYSDSFATHYLVPLTAAIWSTAPRGVLDFPIEYALRFFDNHGLLQLRGLRWRTIVGGSHAYVDAVRERFAGVVHVGDRVAEIIPADGGVVVRTKGGIEQQFDSVVIATHPDQAHEILAADFTAERAALQRFEYTTSDVVLHTDTGLLPRRERARASWNYQLPTCSLEGERPTMTYYMNRLQGLDADAHYSVTLNRGSDIDDRKIIARESFAHPRYTSQTLRGQEAIAACQGANRVHFAGAWLGDGFHEAGFTSGRRAATAILATAPAEAPRPAQPVTS